MSNESEALFYAFPQNNTYGYFEEDDNVAHVVFIEATSVEQALELANYKGLYFYGTETGIDCSCCGDRWYEPSEGTKVPMLYGEKIQDVTLFYKNSYRIHYLDGRVENGSINKR